TVRSCPGWNHPSQSNRTRKTGLATETPSDEGSAGNRNRQSTARSADDPPGSTFRPYRAAETYASRDSAGLAHRNSRALEPYLCRRCHTRPCVGYEERSGDPAFSRDGNRTVEWEEQLIV